jgi:AhpD family alkylhydroperoxidase
MKLAPIEQPPSLWMKVVYQLSERRFGKVLGVIKVIYARKPEIMPIALKIARTMERLSLEPSLRYLVQVQTSRQNGCAFCEDLVMAEAVRGKLGDEKFRALADYRTSPAFSERERAALAFAEEATQNRRLTPQTEAAVRAHFTEKEIIELTWLNAAENYYNLQAAVLGVESDGLATR